MEPQLEKILKLKPSTFVYNSDTTERNLMGFIAQEIKQEYPLLVSEFGETLEDGSKYMMVEMTRLIPALTKAIQEQQAQIASLQAQLKALAEATGHLLL